MFVPVALSVAGIFLLIFGDDTAGYVSLVGGIVLRVLLYVAARFHERFANRNAKTS